MKAESENGDISECFTRENDIKFIREVETPLKMEVAFSRKVILWVK